MPIIDCVYDRGQFFVPLSLGSSGPHYFIFDTGAGISAIDEGLATELGLVKIAHTELAGTAGTITVDQVRIARIVPLCRNLGVDELAWYGLTPTKQDLSAFQVPLPHTREAGLLGARGSRVTAGDDRSLGRVSTSSSPAGLRPCCSAHRSFA